MRKDFNVYQWRRDHLFENLDGVGVFIMQQRKDVLLDDGKTKVNHDGYFKTKNQNIKLETVEADFESKGYKFIGMNDFEDSSMGTEYRYYFTKKNKI